MYVICAGMYRSCSTWQYDVLARILEQHRSGSRLGYLTGDEFAEYDDTEGRPCDGWRVLKSHEEHPRFRAAVAEGRAVVIYAHRDLRDVVYSLMHKRSQSFDGLLTRGMIHQVIENDRFWTSRPGVLIQRYENLISDPTTGIVELAAAVGIEMTGWGEAAVLASEYSLEANRRRTSAIGRQLIARGVNLSDPSSSEYADQETLLHWNHLRDGRAGGWRERATARERAMLARIGNRWLRRRGYETDQPARVVSGPLGVVGHARDRWLQGRGWLACRLRCASLRHPVTALAIKSALGIALSPRPHAANQPILAACDSSNARVGARSEAD